MVKGHIVIIGFLQRLDSCLQRWIYSLYLRLLEALLQIRIDPILDVR